MNHSMIKIIKLHNGYKVDFSGYDYLNSGCAKYSKVYKFGEEDEMLKDIKTEINEEGN